MVVKLKNAPFSFKTLLKGATTTDNLLCWVLNEGICWHFFWKLKHCTFTSLPTSELAAHQTNSK